MNAHSGHLHIAPRFDVPNRYEEFSQISVDVVHQLQAGALKHTATNVRSDSDHIYLDNRPEKDPADRTPHMNFDSIAIYMGGGALSVCMEHRHESAGHDHEATIGPERTTLSFQRVTRHENWQDVTREHAILLRTNASRVFPEELVTDDKERSRALTLQLQHVLAAVGIKIALSEKTEPSEIPALQGESLQIAS